MMPPSNECPPVARTTEGRHEALRASAAAPYLSVGGGGKSDPDARILRVNTRRRLDGDEYPKVTYRASTGLIWAFDGKKGRVVRMLATMGQGVTQWDCYPWHTRLGGTIHALREAGMVIDTVREGPFRHARYFLRTPGTVIIQPENRGEGQ